MTEEDELASLLRWAIPRMGLRLRGFANFRGTLKKRIGRRVAELGLSGLGDYRARLASDPEEWNVLDALCRITISRMYRDRGVMDRLREEILPQAALRARAAQRSARIWSAGCASGEEPYTLALLWHLEVAPSGPSLDLVATEVDPALVVRAERGAFAAGSLRELPGALRDRGLLHEGDAWVVRREMREGVTLLVQDLRTTTPEGLFDVILCRNVAFTYFDEPLQHATAARLAGHLVDPGGVLVVGDHETAPAPFTPLAPCFFQRARG